MYIDISTDLSHIQQSRIIKLRNKNQCFYPLVHHYAGLTRATLCLELNKTSWISSTSAYIIIFPVRTGVIRNLYWIKQAIPYTVNLLWEGARDIIRHPRKPEKGKCARVILLLTENYIKPRLRVPSCYDEGVCLKTVIAMFGFILMYFLFPWTSSA